MIGGWTTPEPDQSHFYFKSPMTYEEQLQDRRWTAKRQEIIDRDLGMCQECMSSRHLNVHHKKYIKGKMAWEYPNSMLITLCTKCHENHHSVYKIVIVDKAECIPELFRSIYRDLNSLMELDKRINAKDNG